jgi:hypothetical protein
MKDFEEKCRRCRIREEKREKERNIIFYIKKRRKRGASIIE